MFWIAAYLTVGALLGLYIVWDAPYKTVGHRVEPWGVALIDGKFRVTSWPKFTLTVGIMTVGWLPLFVWVAFN